MSISTLHKGDDDDDNNNNNNNINDDNNNNNKLQLGCHPVPVVILHVHDCSYWALSIPHEVGKYLNFSVIHVSI